MSFRLGIVGAGGISQFHAQAAREVGLSIAGVCDVDLARAERQAAECDGAVATDSLPELLAMDDVQAVSIAVPNRYHRKIAVAALQAGKDVLLEKPMAMNVAECDEIIDARDSAGRILQVGFVCRGAPASIAVKRLIDEGTLGTIYHAKATTCRRRGVPGLGRWFTTKSESGGGPLIDLGVHLVDLVLYLTGFPRPTRVSGACTTNFGSPPERYLYTEMWAGPPNLDGVFDVDDGVTALVRFDSGMMLELNTTWAANLPNDVLRDGVLLLGDKGGCFFDLLKNEVVYTIEQAGAVVDCRPDLPLVDGWTAGWTKQYERFEEAVRTRSEPIATAEHGRAVQEVIDAIYQSSDEGGEVCLR